VVVDVAVEDGGDGADGAAGVCVILAYKMKRDSEMNKWNS